jgi:hypothetical protein
MSSSEDDVPLSRRIKQEEDEYNSSDVPLVIYKYKLTDLVEKKEKNNNKSKEGEKDKDRRKSQKRRRRSLR